MDKKFYAILHNIRSAYNVGSMFRTADALGIDKIFLTGYSPSPDQHKQISKTALGAEKNIEWEKCWHIHQVFDKLKKQKVKIYALELDSQSEKLEEIEVSGSLALLVGNEVKGLSTTVLSQTDSIVEIPMFGKKESLNVAVAFGIAGYVIRKGLSK
ncbi:MAG: TrmH family RNA methyltransferase [Patescibacteria group bacterium]|jgi:23S rRNA (guanosine2251-2'-O)-methyltransferase|nr:TrmH family RNA methyltransferase [Patescibacteria group bacterium]